MQEYLFILLTQTGTIVSRLIRLFTRKPYNHASVAIDLSLDQMYSFCRSNCRFPLPATFNQELVGSGTFGLFQTIPCEVYAVPVTPEEKLRLVQYLDYLKGARDFYSYNILGLWTTFFHIRWTRKKKMHCAEFVANALQQAGIPLGKQPSLYTPDDFRYLPMAHLIYRGDLNQFRMFALSLAEAAVQAVPCPDCCISGKVR